MLTGNVSVNPLTTHRLPDFTNTSNNSSLFVGRVVKNGSDILVGTSLKQASENPTRVKILKEIIKDGGEAMFKDFIKRNISSAVRSGHPWQPFIGTAPVSAPKDISLPLIPDDLTSRAGKGEFVRLGNPFPSLLLETLYPKGGARYKFRNKDPHNIQMEPPPDKKNVELSNCLFRIEDSNGTLAPSKTANPELQKLTGAIMNSCSGIGKEAYSGQFDVKIDMKDAESVTFFRLMPHSESSRYLDKENKVYTLPMGISANTYRSMMNDGMRFEDGGPSPLTMNVEYYDGKHFFTVKQQADYSSFKLAESRCDMPFEGSMTPLDKAICCRDGERQKQDVKYLYHEELRVDTFNVKFSVDFPKFAGESAVGLSLTTLAINDQLVARSRGWIGNNNQDDQSNPCGYHAQFGISDASDDLITIKFKNPEFNPGQRLNLDKSVGLEKKNITRIDGECQRSPIIETIQHQDHYQGPEKMTSDRKFARVGMPVGELLTERLTENGETIYRFENRGLGETPELEKNVELTNCFFRDTRKPPRTGQSHLESQQYGALRRLTTERLSGCGGASKKYYFGDFDIKVQMGKPGKVTVFRIMPQSDGRQYMKRNGKIMKLRINADPERYLALKAAGVVFEEPGESPLTMNVEHYDGKHYFTVKARADYATFKDPRNDQPCDITFRGENTPLGKATCCIKDHSITSAEVEEDVKYVHVSPLKSGWFNVKFFVRFADMDYLAETGVALSIDNKRSYVTSIIGNNNFFDIHDISPQLGYYSQFGISGASHDSIVVKFRNLHLEPGMRVNITNHPAWRGGERSELIKTLGECWFEKAKELSIEEILGLG